MWVQMEVAADPAPGHAPHKYLIRTLAGVQAGVLGGAAVLLWILFASSLSERSPWVLVNMIAGVFYGGQSRGSDFGWMTLAGAAVHILQCALASILFAVAMRRRSYVPSLATAMLYVATVGWIAKSFVWKTFNPTLANIAPTFAVSTGFFILGLALSFLPWLERELERDLLLE